MPCGPQCVCPHRIIHLDPRHMNKSLGLEGKCSTLGYQKMPVPTLGVQGVTSQIRDFYRDVEHFI